MWRAEGSGYRTGAPGGEEALPALEPGRVIGLIGAPGYGLTRLGLALLAPPARTGSVAALDTRGWLSPAAAWETGTMPDRLVVVRCPEPRLWPQVAAVLVEGMQAVYAEVPAGVPDAVVRRLAALARSRRAPVVLRPLRGDLPAGVAHLRLEAKEVVWEGPEQGHGRLVRRRMMLEATGKGAGGVRRVFEVEDDGTHALSVVSGLAVAAPGRAAG